MIRCSTTVLSALVISVDFNMEAIDALDAFGGVGVDDVDLADAGVHHLWVDVLWAGERLHLRSQEFFQLPTEVDEAAKARGGELDLWETAEKLLIELEELGWGSAGQQIGNITTGV